MKNILVTGSQGFIGKTVCAVLIQNGFNVRGAARSLDSESSGKFMTTVPIGNIGRDTEWTDALKGMDAVVHLAARVHVMKEVAADPLSQYREVNVEGTERIARRAAEMGVKRFIYISSAKVNGERSNVPYNEEDKPFPKDPYAVSKWEAEQRLGLVSAETGLESTVLRPPLVYGPGVRGNFLRLLEYTYRGWPLPLAGVKNQRSMIYVGNIADAISACLSREAAIHQTFFVSDGVDISSADLIRSLSQWMNRPDRLWRLPERVLRAAGSVTGRPGTVQRLVESLRIDSSKIRRLLSWVPPFTLQDGLKVTAEHFVAGKVKG